MVTRKIYIALAKAIRNCDISANSRAEVIREIVKVLRNDNHLFDEDRFRMLANSVKED